MQKNRIEFVVLKALKKISSTEHLVPIETVRFVDNSESAKSDPTTGMQYVFLVICVNWPFKAHSVSVSLQDLFTFHPLVSLIFPRRMQFDSGGFKGQ